MSKAPRMFAMAMISAAILAVFIPSAAFAENSPSNGNGTQSQNCSCSGECICNNDCEPIVHYYNYNWSEKGPHGAQNGKVLQ